MTSRRISRMNHGTTSMNLHSIGEHSMEEYSKNGDLIESFNDENSSSAGMEANTPTLMQQPKTYTKSGILVLLALLAGSLGLSYGIVSQLLAKRDRKTPLKFRKEEDGMYRFKIVQLSDLHFGEGGSSWRTDHGVKTWELVDRIIDAESPDLIVLSGDQVSAYDRDGHHHAAKQYQMIGEKLSEYKIHWAMIFGETDDMDMEIESDGVNRTVPAKYIRDDLLQIDMKFPYSLTQRGPEALFGLTNYILNIAVEKDTPAAQIYFFDSGGGSLPKQLQQSQVNWFAQSYGQLPAVAFQHIPTVDMKFNEKCVGYHGEEVEPLDFDPGLIDAMSESTRVYFLAAGHSHGNHYCCPFTRYERGLLD